MRPGHNSVEYLLESGLNACRVHVEIMPDARGCGSLHEPARKSSGGHFHLIGMEECLLIESTLQERTHLHNGDLVIFQGGTRHTLLPMPRDRAELPAIGSASILYGEFELSMGNTSPLLCGLPSCLVVRSHDASECYRQLASILLAAARETRLGQQVLINKLASSLLAFALCECAFQIEASHGVSAAIQDARIVRALQAIHDRLDKQWSVRSLASVAGMSRSTFALYFTTVIGMPPMQYVALLRVNQAKQLLQDSGLSVAKVAEMLGYSSEAAFRKLFKRVEGVGPGNVRAAARFNFRQAERGANKSMGDLRWPQASTRDAPECRGHPQRANQMLLLPSNNTFRDTDPARAKSSVIRLLPSRAIALHSPVGHGVFMVHKSCGFSYEQHKCGTTHFASYIVVGFRENKEPRRKQRGISRTTTDTDLPCDNESVTYSDLPCEQVCRSSNHPKSKTSESPRQAAGNCKFKMPCSIAMRHGLLVETLKNPIR